MPYATAEEQAAAARNGYEAATGDDDADGVETVDVDAFDHIFGDGADLMNVDLPTNFAVSAREEAQSKNLNEKLDAIEFETRDSCWEEGFDLDVKDGICGACRHDKDPVKNGPRPIKYTRVHTFILIMTGMRN